jgi:hypothetical protein
MIWFEDVATLSVSEENFRYVCVWRNSHMCIAAEEAVLLSSGVPVVGLEM